MINFFWQSVFDEEAIVVDKKKTHYSCKLYVFLPHKHNTKAQKKVP